MLTLLGLLQSTSHGLDRSNHRVNEPLIHLKPAFVLREVPLSMSLVENAPLMVLEPDGMRQALEDQITVVRPIAGSAKSC